MLFVYPMLTLGVFLLSPSIALATVGSVDDHELQKVAACNYNPRGHGQGDERAVNPGNVLANLGTVVEEERPKKRKQPRRRRGRGGSVQ